MNTITDSPSAGNATPRVYLFDLGVGITMLPLASNEAALEIFKFDANNLYREILELTKSASELAHSRPEMADAKTLLQAVTEACINALNEKRSHGLIFYPNRYKIMDSPMRKDLKSSTMALRKWLTTPGQASANFEFGFDLGETFITLITGKTHRHYHKLQYRLDRVQKGLSFFDATLRKRVEDVFTLAQFAGANRLEQTKQFWTAVLHIRDAFSNSMPIGAAAPNTAERKPSSSANSRVKSGPITVAQSLSGRVKLGQLHDPVYIDGQQYPSLTKTRYDVILALLNAKTPGLKGVQLKSGSNHEDAVNILKSMKKKLPGWKDVITLPGTAHSGGYRIL